MSNTITIALTEEQVNALTDDIRRSISQLFINELKHFNTTFTPYMNKKETCKYLDISNNTLDKWIEKGLPVIKIDKVCRFSKDDINRWLYTNKIN